MALESVSKMPGKLGTLYKLTYPLVFGFALKLECMVSFTFFEDSFKAELGSESDLASDLEFSSDFLQIE